MKKWIVTNTETGVTIEYDNYDRAKFAYDVLTEYKIIANFKEES